METKWILRTRSGTRCIAGPFPDEVSARKAMPSVSSSKELPSPDSWRPGAAFTARLLKALGL